MKILLTGAAGRVGRNILADGLAQRYEVVAFDCAAFQEKLAGVKYMSGSVLDRKELSDAMRGAEAVIHLAGIPYDIPPLHQVFETNVQGTYNALDLAVENGVKTFLHMSSIMTYGFGRSGTALYLPIDEHHPSFTNDTYGMGKLLTEQMCRAFSQKFGLRTLCFRLTHFTSFTRPYPDVFPYQGDRGIETIHQYIESRDFVDLLECSLSSTDVQHDVFLAAGPDSGHVLPTQKVVEMFHPGAELRYKTLTAASPFVSMSKAKRLLGFVPRHSWRLLGLKGDGTVDRSFLPS